MLVGALAAVSVLATAEVAFAASGVSLDPKPDGTLSLVGNGWRPGQELVVSLGTDEFPAVADSSGSFEIPTGLLVKGGPPLSITVRRVDPRSLAFGHLGPPPELDGPNPFALLFAQSLASGAQLFALTAGGLTVLRVAVRALRARATR